MPFTENVKWGLYLLSQSPREPTLVIDNRVPSGIVSHYCNVSSSSVVCILWSSLHQEGGKSREHQHGIVSRSFIVLMDPYMGTLMQCLAKVIEALPL